MDSTVKKHIMSGGPRRLPSTVPSLIFSALRLVRQLQGQDGDVVGEEVPTTPKHIFQLLNETIEALSSGPEIVFAMESLASALHEVSAEARETKEKLLNSQVEHESYETQIEDLKLVLNATGEKYKSMLDDARREIDVLTFSIEKSKIDFEKSKAEWEQRELHLVSCLKKTEEINSSLGKEINRLVRFLKETEEEASANREEEAQLKENLKEVEAETIHLQEALKEATAE